MKNRTKRTLLQAATAVAAVCAAAVIFLPAASMARPAAPDAATTIAGMVPVDAFNHKISSIRIR